MRVLLFDVMRRFRWKIIIIIIIIIMITLFNDVSCLDIP